MKEIVIATLLVAQLVCSVLTFYAYALDKRRAILKKRRIPEKTLLILPWLMGGLGGFLGIYVVRHKTRHWYFPLHNMLAFLTQGSLLIALSILL